MADPWDAYAARLHSAGGDEVIGADGVPSHGLVADAVERLGLNGLLVARADAARLVSDDGVRSAEGSHGRWAIDPLPLVVSAEDWTVLERGLDQRARLLDALLCDLYGDRRTLRHGLIPPAVVGGHSGFLPEAHSMRLPGARQLILTGTDVGRVGGAWVVLGERSAVPAGLGYAMVNRRIVSRALASVHRGTRLRRLREFFDSVRITLDGLSPQQDRRPKIGLLWPGADSPGAYEMGFLAAMLGTSLVSGGDLLVRDGRLWLDAPDRQTRIDVLLRRVDAADCDPLEVSTTRRLGVAGLMEASRLGRLSVANPFGADALVNPALTPFLPAVARTLLGEDLLLNAADTWWCGDERGLGHVLAHLSELVVRPIDPRSGSSVEAWTLSSDDRDALARRLAAEPWAWVGQDPLFASTAPVVTPRGLVPRRVVLRAFGLAADDGYRIMPGGLARVAPDDEALKVAGRGVLAKDVWVLDDAESPATGGESVRLAPAPAAEPWAGRTLAPRAADNLYWFGRYVERLDATARLLRLAIDLSEDFADRPGTLGYSVLGEVSRTLAALHGLAAPASGEPTQARAALRLLSVDADVTGSLAQCFEGLSRCAYEVPNVMSGDVWHVLATIRRRLDALAAEPDDFQAGLLDLRQSTLALFGVASESLMKDHSWAMIDIGVRLERAVSTLRLIASAFAIERPLMVRSRLSDAVMEACDSSITHRRRSAAGAGPTEPLNAAAALLVLETANPRGVVPQLERAASDCAVLGDDLVGRRVRALVDRLTGASATLTEGGTTDVIGVLDNAVAEAATIKALLRERHFTRRSPLHTQQISWSDGNPLVAEEWSSQL